MTVSDARRPKALEDGNAKLKKLLVEQRLAAAEMKELLAKNGEARRDPGLGAAEDMEETKEALRALVDRIVLMPADSEKGLGESSFRPIAPGDRHMRPEHGPAPGGNPQVF